MLRDTWRARQGWRVPRSGRVLEALVPAVLEQKVTGREAWQAWRWLVRRYGEPAPGPAGLLPDGLRVPPAARTWAGIPSWDWHRAGVDQARSRAAVTAAGTGRPAGGAHRPRRAGCGGRRCGRCPASGCGPRPRWPSAPSATPTPCRSATTTSPSQVGWALVGEKVDDDAMLELLEPYRGHRYRVQRLVELSGLAPPRRGPRYAGRDYRAM